MPDKHQTSRQLTVLFARYGIESFLESTSLLVALSLPAAWVSIRVLEKKEPVALNALVRNSARLHLHFGVGSPPAGRERWR